MTYVIYNVQFWILWDLQMRSRSLEVVWVGKNQWVLLSCEVWRSSHFRFIVSKKITILKVCYPFAKRDSITSLWYCPTDGQSNTDHYILTFCSLKSKTQEIYSNKLNSRKLWLMHWHKTVYKDYDSGLSKANYKRRKHERIRK